MNALEKANNYLKKEACYKNEDYKKIDKLIKPLCELLSEKGFLTLHSCSAHIEEEKNSVQWYALFIATKPISVIKNIVKKINKKHGYKITIQDDRKLGREICGLTRRWRLQWMLWDVKTKKELIEINKNIYEEFKKELK
jgi:hypothetical protein